MKPVARNGPAVLLLRDEADGVGPLTEGRVLHTGGDGALYSWRLAASILAHGQWDEWTEADAAELDIDALIDTAERIEDGEP